MQWAILDIRLVEEELLVLSPERMRDATHRALNLPESESRLRPLIAQPWKIMSIGLREWAYIGRSI